MSVRAASRRRPALIGLAVAILAALALAAAARWTRPVRRGVAAYTELLAAVNRQDLDAVQRLCSTRYLRTHALTPAAEGGVVGMPRNIHTNFQAWREGPNVWICPTNRVGPIYQFVPEGDAWRFDGPIGVLQGRGQVVRYADEPAAE
jgi:hypothetical protein